MVEDTGIAQARELLGALYQQVSKTSHQLEAVEYRNRRVGARGNAYGHRHQSALRRELYEEHRLIAGLHRRFPETDPPLFARDQ